MTRKTFDTLCALGLAAALVWIGYYSGKQSEHASAGKVLADTIAKTEARLAVNAHAVDTLIVHTNLERMVYRNSPVKVVNDTTLRVDSVLVHVPVPVVQVIARCDSLVTADSITIHAVVAQLADMTTDRDLWKQRALLDEQQKSRFGLKFGLAAGAALALVVVHFIR